MRIAFLGTPEFAVPSLKMLIEQGHEIEVFTQPDRPRDRGHGLAMPPVKAAALEAGIAVHQFERIKNEEGVRALKDFVPELDYVMEKDGRIIGQNIFVRATIKADDGRDIPVMAMGPICITPELKRQGYGKAILDYTLEKAKELGCGAVCFEGNIDFYGKSGFTYAEKYGIRYHGLPEGEDASFFLCKELIDGYLDGVTGEYATPQGYFVDEAEVDEFDKQFPPKEKLKLPGQLF